MTDYDALLDNLYPEWHAQASCNGMSPDIWFPVATTTQGRIEATAEARRICRKCPVRRQCAAAAKANGETWGVWGGNDHEIKRPNSGATDAA